MVRQGAEMMGLKYCLGTPQEEVGLELGWELDLYLEWMKERRKKNIYIYIFQPGLIKISKLTCVNKMKKCIVDLLISVA